MVRYPEQERKSLGNVKEMRIRTSGGKEVPFSQVAEVKMEHGYASIHGHSAFAWSMTPSC